MSVDWYILTQCKVQLHTYTFDGPFSRTTRVGWYQKGKTKLDFTEARDSEWQWHQLGHMQVYTSFQTDDHTSTSPPSLSSLLSPLEVGSPSLSLRSMLYCGKSVWRSVFSSTSGSGRNMKGICKTGNSCVLWPTFRQIESRGRRVRKTARLFLFLLPVWLLEPPGCSFLPYSGLHCRRIAHGRLELLSIRKAGAPNLNL